MTQHPPDPPGTAGLESVAILKGVGLAHRQQIENLAVHRTLNVGDVLIRQGEQGKEMYFVMRGDLGVALGEPTAEPIAIIGVGETVGELSVLSGDVASAHVVARTECEVLALDEDAFWELTQESHAFAINLLVKLADRLRKNNATVSTNIERRRLYERAAMFDSLTGIHNRRWLDDTLHRLVERHERGGHAFCLALIDIDHFKGFNDSHGHDAGDAVLTSVAATMAKNLRPTDLVARFGGEEFVILFPDTNLEEARFAAERMRVVVAETAVSVGVRALPRVTISIGIAQLREKQAPAALLKNADAAMYKAKQSGRNRVVLSEA